MGTISINGKVYSGHNVTIGNGCVTIDGVVQQADVKGVVEIRVIDGVIGSLTTTDATVNCDAVHGDVKAGGSVNCDDVSGSVTCGGSVNCQTIGGNVFAGGSVRRA